VELQSFAANYVWNVLDKQCSKEQAAAAKRTSDAGSVAVSVAAAPDVADVADVAGLIRKCRSQARNSGRR